MQTDNEMDARRRVQAALDYIESHLLEPIDIRALAEVCNYSQSRFQQLFRHIVEVPALKYIRERRLTEAKVDLLAPESVVGVVAAKYGYDSRKAFSRAFKRYHGIDPEKYQRTHEPLQARPPSIIEPTTAASRSPSLSQTTLKRLRARNWTLELELDVPDLRPEVVQYALFTVDPLLGYKNKLHDSTRRGTIDRLLRGYEDPDSARRHVIAVHCRTLWDLLFADVTGDQLHLLAGRTLTDACQTISSNAPEKVRWIATKTTGPGEWPLCWAVRVQTKPGTHEAVRLDRTNAIDVATLVTVYTEEDKSV